MKTINQLLIILLIICTLNCLIGCTKNLVVSSSELTHQSNYRITNIYGVDNTAIDFLSSAKSEIQDSVMLVNVDKAIQLQFPVSEIDSIYAKEFSPGQTALFIVAGTAAILAVIGLYAIRNFNLKTPSWD